MDDHPLVSRAKAGDVHAQAALFRRHAPQLTSLLTHLLASVADAEDAVQDAFVIAFRDLRQLRDLGVFGGWLRKIAVHQAHRRFRRRRLYRALGLDRHVEDATLEQLVDAAALPDLRAEVAQLDQLLCRMPIKDRTAWVLRYVEGYELTDVAQSCDCSLATAKRRIAAAQARITKTFGEGWAGP